MACDRSAGETERITEKAGAYDLAADRLPAHRQGASLRAVCTAELGSREQHQSPWSLLLRRRHDGETQFRIRPLWLAHIAAQNELNDRIWPEAAGERTRATTIGFP
jgi:hypothetical protein